MSKDCLPEHIKNGKHTDYPWPLKWVPRRWTSFCWPVPKKLAGNQILTIYKAKDGSVFAAPKPIPRPGEWQFSRPFYVAFTTKSRWSFRLGARWDDVDFYTTFPAFKIWRISNG